ncbi:MAG: glycoside hydrolase family 16 protein, partial [Ignavibacteriota bacterium]
MKLQRKHKGMYGPESLTRRQLLVAAAGALPVACRRHSGDSDVSIQFTRVPQDDSGGKEKNDIIEGMVQGAKPGQQIVLYARSGKWWIQPLRDNPFTRLQRSGKFTNATHLGTDYAAILVDHAFRPPLTYDALPSPGDGVVAVAKVRGQEKPPSTTIQFSGFEWRVRDAPSNRGGNNLYSVANVSVDASGFLHLRANQTGKDWTCAEVAVTRSLGYGTYRFVVHDVTRLDPSMVFAIFTWDYAGGEQGNREMDIEITRWGDPKNQNAQYVVQPYHVAANVARYEAPSGTLIHEMRWEPGRVAFKTAKASGAPVAEHVFTSGVPAPGIESIRMNHYAFHGGVAIKETA